MVVDEPLLPSDRGLAFFRAASACAILAYAPHDTLRSTSVCCPHTSPMSSTISNPASVSKPAKYAVS